MSNPATSSHHPLRDLRLLPYWIIMTVAYLIVLLMAASIIGGGIAATLAIVWLVLWFAGWLIVSYPYCAGAVGLVIGFIAFRDWIRTRHGR